MADINVFELTNKELHKNDSKPAKKVSKKSVRESVKRSAKRRRPFNIPANKLKLESLSNFLMLEDEEAAESDVVAQREESLAKQLQEIREWQCKSSLFLL